MARIVCFSDTAAHSCAVQRALRDSRHDLHMLPASQLTAATREAVRSLAPDLILLELTGAYDNAHLLFFLRSEHVTRRAPIILISDGDSLGRHAAILDADAYLRCPFEPSQLHQLIAGQLPLQAALAAA